MTPILLITTFTTLAAVTLLLMWRWRIMSSKRAAIVRRYQVVQPDRNQPRQFLPLEDPNNARWRFINDWRVTPQADDRPQMRGDSVISPVSDSVGRSIARRRHQTMYKRWSQNR